jgi:DNA repair photolyase
MSLIYEPKGKAREYSPLALNVYSGGCDHRCEYCYCSGVMRGAWGDKPRPRNLAALDKEAAEASRQILLCFMSDPYCAAEQSHRKTREALQTLRKHGCSVAILTKGGRRCLDDLGIFTGWPGGRIKVGATITFNSSALSRKWEPGAADPGERVETLAALKSAGIKTWASVEPVIIASESLAIIEASLPYVDAYKVGKWNHDARASGIDWAAFGVSAVEMIREAGKGLYVKNDLRPFFPPGYLTEKESDMSALELPQRPSPDNLLND